eukprot:Lankesteria_metandrocarpae@DN5371_c0_g1_i13.p2
MTTYICKMSIDSMWYIATMVGGVLAGRRNCSLLIEHTCYDSCYDFCCGVLYVLRTTYSLCTYGYICGSAIAATCSSTTTTTAVQSASVKYVWVGNQTCGLSVIIVVLYYQYVVSVQYVCYVY